MFTPPVFATDGLGLSANSAISIEHYTGTVLYSKNADVKMQPASTTKIMTAAVVLKNEKNLDRKIKVSYTAAYAEGSSMYLCENEEITIKDLLYGLMLVSGNDAATTLAENVMGGKQQFVDEMNNIAKDLGLSSTQFKNPSGLPEDGHYTTAKELALITSYAYTLPMFSEITGTREYRTQATNTSAVRLLKNHNKLLRLYEYCDGGKTGFTKTAGRCLVTSGGIDKTRIINVTLNAGDDWNDHIKLFDSCLPRIEMKEVECKNGIFAELPVTNGTKSITSVTNENPLSAVYIDGKQIPYDIEIHANKFMYAPVNTGDILGMIELKQNNKTVSYSNLISRETAESKPEYIKKDNIFIILKKIILSL